MRRSVKDTIPPEEQAADVVSPQVAAIDESSKEKWRERSREGIAAVTANHDKILTRVIAMAAIDFVANGAENSNSYYDERLKTLGLPVSGSKVAMRAAVLATRLDRGNPENGKEAGKQLDAIASGIEGLVLAAGGDFDWAYTDECVEQLTGIAATAGGIRSLANLARNERIDDNPRGVIALDAKKVASISEQLATAALGGVSTNRFKIAFDNDNGTLSPVPNLSLDIADVVASLSGKDLGEQRAQVLHELETATIAISLEDTGLPKVHDADPNDKKTKKRLTEAHLLFCPDGSVIISAHLAPQASNVVRVTDMASVIDDWPAHHVMLPPGVYRKLGLNLAKVAQRNAVTISEEPASPGSTLIFRTWLLRSSAALHPRYQPDGPGLKFSLRFPTYGAKGNSRDTVHVIREDCVFDPVATFDLNVEPTGFRNAIVASHERMKRASSTQRTLALTIRDERFEVTISKENVLVASASGSMGAIAVMANDFRNFLLLLEALRPSQVELALDQQKGALRWAFQTQRARYEVFMPAATDQGTRKAHAFQPINIVAPASAG